MTTTPPTPVAEPVLPEPSPLATPPSGPASAGPCEGVHELPVEHIAKAEDGSSWSGKVCPRCNNWVTEPVQLAAEEVAGRMTLGIITMEDGAWQLVDKFGNVAAVGPAISRQLIMDIMARATGSAGQQVQAGECPPDCSEGHTFGPLCAQQAPQRGPQLHVVGQDQELATLPAEHIVVPGRVRDREG